MNYQYEFVKISPAQLRVQIRYSATDRADIFRNLATADFSAVGLKALAEAHAASVFSQWEALDAAPAEPEIENGTAIAADYTPPPISVPQPAYDDLTEKLEEGTEVRADGKTYQAWAVVPQTQAEKDASIANWRSNKAVSMRQIQLAMQQQGIRGNVQSVINQMPEPDKTLVSIEWDHGSTVERSYPWVASLGQALGMTDTDLDDLFKLAETL